jgi:hypothetical protein
VKAKVRYILAACLAVLIFLSVFQVFFPLAIAYQSVTNDQASWLALAQNAWAYFQPGVGVNAQTGLHGAGLGWHYFTEWDLATYIQAIINAERLGLIQNYGPWGFNYRIGLILNFLETRNLTSNGLPYSLYDWNGTPCGNGPTGYVDEGSLYMALYDLEVFRPDLAANVTSIIERNNNKVLLPNPALLSGSTNLYDYYVATAFKDLGLFPGYADVPSEILNTIVSQPNVTAYGVQLPTANICCEPLLLTFFEANPQDSRFTWLLSQVNLAQEARYETTGNFTAFSEGNTGLNDPNYVYEFVVDSNGKTFELAADSNGNPFEVEPAMAPIIYLKVAVGFDAIFESVYTQSTVNYILGCLPASSSGFQEGVDENGRVVRSIIDRTNGLILAAAWYAISNMPSSSSSPLPTSTPVATPTLKAIPSPSFSPLSSSSPSASPTSPSVSSITTANRHGNWLNEPILITATVVITCLFLVLPLKFLLKRNHSKAKQR